MGEHGRSTASPIAPGSQVDHFKVLRLLGRGGMAEVFLARDLLLGRKVALKVIRPDSLGSQEAVDRFLFEARATAKFNHPNIVTVHAAGEHGGVPYVALEYIEGQTLRKRLEEERPSPREAARIGLATAEALAEAHRNGILHRDLKPENILLARDGRLRVVDFGLAKAIASGPILEPEECVSGPSDMVFSATQDSFETHDDAIRGTPMYMAPEQWSGLAPSGATDVWALGALLYEMTVGFTPYRAASALKMAVKVCGPDPAPRIPDGPEVPEELVELVACCLAKDPEARPSAAEVCAVLGEMLSTGRRKSSEDESPFRGLRPFSERHAEFFHGRGPEVAAFLERIREEPVLPVLGPSGAGKSSFVQAGVVPRLREQGRWVVLSMRPGARPFRTLASRLLSRERATWERTLASSAKAEEPAPVPRDEHDEERLAAELRASPLRLNLLLSRLAEGEAAKVLLFVDQVEEVYTLVEDEETRTAFMEAICGAADDADCPVRVVFTLRDDFLGRLAEGPVARNALSHVTVLRSPGPEGLEEILTRPVEDVGYAYDDPGLVAEMVEAVRGEPACLPLLQFATRMLWDRRDRHRRLLCRDVYGAMGGVEGALANHADGVLEGLSPSQVKVARSLLLGLVTADGTRKVVARSELLETLGAEAQAVLDRLTQARLVSVRKGQGSADDTAELELVHESLITRWGRLSRWVDENREEMAFIAEVGEAAALWERRGRRDDEAWTGDALTEAQRNLDRLSILPPRTVGEFLDAGQRRAERAQRRKTVRRATLTAFLALVAVAGTVFSVAFRQQRQEALEQREDARHSLAQAQREAAQAAFVRGELHEARARLRASLEVQDSPLARALWWQLSRDPLLWQRRLGASTYAVAFSPGGETLAVACQDKSVYLFETKTRAMRVLRGNDDQVMTIAFSPDGRSLASGTMSGAVRLWRLADESVRLLAGPEGQVSAVAFSPDGRRLAAGGADRVVHVWDLSAGGPAESLVGHADRVSDLSWHPNGESLASASGDRTVRIWNLADRAAPRVLEGHSTTVSAVAWSPSGETLASTGHDWTTRLWRGSDGAALAILRGHAKAIVSDLAWSPDGQTLATGAMDRTVRLWDVESEACVRVLRGHEEGVVGLAWSPDGRSLASTAYDSSVRLWDAATSQDLAPDPGHSGVVFSVAWTRGGEQVLSSGGDETVRVWDAGTGLVQRSLVAHVGFAHAVAASPRDGSHASAGADGMIRVWSAESGAIHATLVGHSSTVNSVAFSPDGGRIASGGVDRTVRLWDVEEQRQIAVLRGHEQGVWSVAWSPDGRTLASGDYGAALRLWDVETLEERALLRGHEALVWSVAWSPDGLELATGSVDRTVRLWDAATGSGTVLATLPGRAYSVSWSPDGTTVAATSSDGVVRILGRDGSVRRELRGHRSEVNAVAFSPDGERLVSAGDDGVVRIWEAATGRPFWRAPLLASAPVRLLTQRGWDLLDGSPPSPGSSRAWERAAEERAVVASQSEDRSILCLLATNGELEIWDLEADRVLATERVEGAQDLVATPNGCATLSELGARLHRTDGAARELAPRASALAWSEGRLLVATDRHIHSFDERGSAAGTHEVGVGVTAVALADGHLVLGFEEGNLEVRNATAREDSAPAVFDDAPSSPVVRLLGGPMDTIVVGFANGQLAIWSRSGGGRLYADRLHGAVTHLLVSEGHLHAATEVGDRRSIDLAVFDGDWCDVLEHVWRAVPIVWRGGRPELAPPPAGHECSR